MSSQKDFINKIIPADDLYWDEIDNKYIALSPDDINSILISCCDSAISEEKDMMKILNWATSVRVGEILLKNFINGQLAINGFDENEEPKFIENTNGNF